MEWINVNTKTPENYNKKNEKDEEISDDIFFHNGEKISVGHYNFNQKKWISISELHKITHWLLPSVPQEIIDNNIVEKYISKLKNAEPGSKVELEREHEYLFAKVEAMIKKHGILVSITEPLYLCFTIQSE